MGDRLWLPEPLEDRLPDCRRERTIRRVELEPVRLLVGVRLPPRRLKSCVDRQTPEESISISDDGLYSIPCIPKIGAEQIGDVTEFMPEIAPQAGQVEEPIGLQSYADACDCATTPAYPLAPQIGPLLVRCGGDSHDNLGCAGFNLRELIHRLLHALGMPQLLEEQRMEPLQARFPRIWRAMVERIGGKMIVAEGSRISHLLSAGNLLEDNRLGQEGIEPDLHRSPALVTLRMRHTGFRSATARSVAVSRRGRSVKVSLA